MFISSKIQIPALFTQQQTLWQNHMKKGKNYVITSASVLQVLLTQALRGSAFLPSSPLGSLGTRLSPHPLQLYHLSLPLHKHKNHSDRFEFPVLVQKQTQVEMLKPQKCSWKSRVFFCCTPRPGKAFQASGGMLEKFKIRKSTHVSTSEHLSYGPGRKQPSNQNALQEHTLLPLLHLFSS